METTPETSGPALFGALRRLDRRKVQGEYCIADCMEILQRGGERIAVFRRDQREEALGINTVERLAAAERLMEGHG